MPEQYTTLGQSTLASGYTSGSGTISVASAASFPSSSTFSIRLNVGAVYTVTNVSGTTFSVLLESGTDVSVSSGATVTEVQTQRALDAIRSDMSSLGAYASLPSTSNQTSGNVYRSSNSPYDFVFDGSLWQPISRPFPSPITVPALTSFTGQDMGSNTVSSTTGEVIITAAGTAADSISAQYVSITPPYKVTALVWPTASSPVEGGLALTDGTKYIVLFNCNNRCGVRKFNTSTSFSGDYVFSSNGDSRGTWLQIEDVGGGATNATKFRVSDDGLNWTQLIQRTRDDFLVETRLAFYINSVINGSSIPVSASVYSRLISFLME